MNIFALLFKIMNLQIGTGFHKWKHDISRGLARQ